MAFARRGVKYCCNGKYIFGTDFCCFMSTNVYYVIMCILMLSLLNPGLRLHVAFTDTVTIALCALCCVLYTLPGIIDPGFFPGPSPNDGSRGSLTQNSVLHNDVPFDAERSLQEQPIHMQTVGAYVIETDAGPLVFDNATVCNTCGITRPPGTSHCDQCERCVVVLDHHCPWEGSDIGIRNYMFFLLSTFGIVIYCLWSLVIAILGITFRRDDAISMIAMIAISGIVGLSSLFGIFFGGGMLMYHTKLIVKDTTTRANKRGRESAAAIVNRAIKNKNDHTMLDETPGTHDQMVVLGDSDQAEDTISTDYPAGKHNKQIFNKAANGMASTTLPANISLQEYRNALKEIEALRGYRIKHPGWRRVICGARMPSLTRMAKREAEITAWVWTVALCSPDIDDIINEA